MEVGGGSGVAEVQLLSRIERKMMAINRFLKANPPCEHFNLLLKNTRIFITCKLELCDTEEEIAKYCWRNDK